VAIRPLPLDGHVHSEWSWDARAGDMERTCARAAALGLPGLAFTEHLDHTVWSVEPGEIEALSALEPGDPVAASSDDRGLVSPPPLDVPGYLAALERCRDLFPDLRVLSGLELGEPHWHADAVARVLGEGSFDRVLGSLHCLQDEGRYREPEGLYGRRDPAEVVHAYLDEVAVLAASDQAFTVLGHIDYPVRSWPESQGPFEPARFEESFRHALRALAGSGRALEVNTVVPLDGVVLRWWHEEGGDAVAFGSDAHEPDRVGHHLAAAAALAEACGFRPGRDPFALWPRA